MEFVPLGYLFERILAVPASSAPVEIVFLIVPAVSRAGTTKYSEFFDNMCPVYFCI